MELHSIGELQKRIHLTAVEKGWWEGEKRNVSEVLLNVISELVEAHEEYRHGHEKIEVYFSEDGKPEGIPIELADAIIRILDAAEGWGVDLEEALELKIDYNKSRPYRHGGLLA